MHQSAGSHSDGPRPVSLKRRLRTIILAASAVACVVCLLMWLRSGFTIDTLIKGSGPRLLTLSSAAGILQLTIGTYSPPYPGQDSSWQWTSMPGSAWSGQPGPTWNWWPSHTTAGTFVFSTRTLTRQEIHLPYWMPTLVTALLPGFWLGSRLRRRWRYVHRWHSGLCVRCGYDLRATKDRCPECGAPIKNHLPERIPPSASSCT